MWNLCRKNLGIELRPFSAHMGGREAFGFTTACRQTKETLCFANECVLGSKACRLFRKAFTHRSNAFCFTVVYGPRTQIVVHKCIFKRDKSPPLRQCTKARWWELLHHHYTQAFGFTILYGLTKSILLQQCLQEQNRWLVHAGVVQRPCTTTVNAEAEQMLHQCMWKQNNGLQQHQHMLNWNNVLQLHKCYWEGNKGHLLNQCLQEKHKSLRFQQYMLESQKKSSPMHSGAQQTPSASPVHAGEK